MHAEILVTVGAVQTFEYESPRKQYLSFDAFNSNTASLKEGPSSARARHRMLVVLPVPGGP